MNFLAYTKKASRNLNESQTRPASKRLQSGPGPFADLKPGIAPNTDLDKAVKRLSEMSNEYADFLHYLINLSYESSILSGHFNLGEESTEVLEQLAKDIETISRTCRLFAKTRKENDIN